jgi:hypothetical protein
VPRGGTYFAPYYWPRPYFYRPHWYLGFEDPYYADPGYLAPAVEPAYEPEGFVRVTGSVDGQWLLTPQRGFTLGGSLIFEGWRWGFALTGQSIFVRAEDGSSNFDHIASFTGHITYAFLAGPQGRLRLEVGGDLFLAPDLLTIGPTGGLSGVLWIGGPFAIEGSAMVTPWPFIQLDTKLALSIGMGPVGLRLGYRVQMLDDRGLADGVIHRDWFSGPWAGLGFVF